MVVLDAAGRVLRPAKLWNDTESAADAADLVDRLGAAAWADAVGTVPVASLTITKLAWLRRAEPDVFAAIATVLLPHDWLTLRLTGRRVTDRGDASGTGYWSPAEERYRPDLLALVGADQAWLPHVLGPEEPAGDWRGAVVGPGTGDNMAAALGLSGYRSLLLQLVWPLEALGWIINLGQRAIASASRCFAWLDGIEPLPQRGDVRSLPPGPLGIRFAAVRFRYEIGSEVLRGVDLELPAGQILAVCGATGAGKTSLLNLLPRFYDPSDGAVLIGDVDTRDVALGELRSAVGIVTQRPVLFSVLLRDNLLAARPDAAWEDVLAACEASGVAGFAEELPQGYDTLIGERGVNLSGGQRQRVALARALIGGARVLVLDDPLSAVDTETERQLVAGLRPAVAGRTVLIASQRLSTILVADRAVVIEGGRVVEDGAPAALLRVERPVRSTVRRRGTCRVGDIAPGSRDCGSTPRDATATSRSSCCWPRFRRPHRWRAGTSSATRSTTVSARTTRAGSGGTRSRTWASTRPHGCSAPPPGYGWPRSVSRSSWRCGGACSTT